MADSHVTDAARLRHLYRLLDQALDLPLDARETWLAQLGPEHQPLVPRLRALLAQAGVETGDFLDTPAAARLGTLAAPEDRPGDLVGPYRLVSELGRGGMATVWLAERHDGQLQRQVALKLPHEGWGHAWARRMARERDILAALEHALIARLYDAGVTAQGRPWLAMERVQGVPIDEYCRRRQLGVAARLALFEQVLAAVSHAHGQLVVHRDLKPANILVTESGEVRLLDFGIAALQPQRETAPGPGTGPTLRAYTPEYAAPEQVLRGQISVRTDVHALGVVLYELLTGRRPYRVGRDAPAALEEAITRGERPLASRSVDDPRLARELRGDLDAILDTALRVDPARRYASVEALAADLRRHGAGEPVSAQRQSAVYRGAKFVRRHRWPIAALSAVVLSLAGGLVLALWQADVARAQAQRAERSRNLITSILEHAGPRTGGGGGALASDLLVRAGQRLAADAGRDDAAVAELGVLVGQGLSALGVPQRGETALRTAVERAQRAFGPRHVVSIKARALLVESLNASRPGEASALVESLVPDALAGLPATAPQAAFALRSLSFQRAIRNEEEPSYAALRQAVEVAERHLGANHDETLISMGLLSNTYGRFGRFDRQLETAAEAQRRAQAQLGMLRPHEVLSAVERWYGEALRRNDRPRDAVPLLRQVLADQRAIDATDTPRVRNAIYQLGQALVEAGEHGEGTRLLSETVWLENLQNADAGVDRLAYGRALAAAHAGARRVDQARSLYAQVDSIAAGLPAAPEASRRLEQARRVRMLAYAGELDAARALHARAAAAATPTLALEAALGEMLIERMALRPRRTAEAGLRAWALDERARARPYAQAMLAGMLAQTFADLDDWDRAEALSREALALFERAQCGPSPLSADAWLASGRVHLRRGRAAQAEQAFGAALRAWDDAHPESPWQAEARHWLARAQAAAGHAEAARRTAQGVRERLRQSRLAPLVRLAQS